MAEQPAPQRVDDDLILALRRAVVMTRLLSLDECAWLVRLIDQARADAAELQRLRELLPIREKQATSFCEANQVLMAERDAAQAEVARLHKYLRPGFEETDLNGLIGANEFLQEENKRLHAIEARAREMAKEGGQRAGHVSDAARRVARYILHGDAPEGGKP